MIAHVVLFEPRPDLSAAERLALVGAFEQAVRDIPTVEGVRVGRRVTTGTSYDGPSTAPAFLVIIDFRDPDGLWAYLHHPSHEALGAQFTSAVRTLFVGDFEEVALDALARLAAGS